jgi:hypothetical protein
MKKSVDLQWHEEEAFISARASLSFKRAAGGPQAAPTAPGRECNVVCVSGGALRCAAFVCLLTKIHIVFFYWWTVCVFVWSFGSVVFVFH